MEYFPWYHVSLHVLPYHTSHSDLSFQKWSRYLSELPSYLQEAVLLHQFHQVRHSYGSQHHLHKSDQHHLSVYPSSPLTDSAGLLTVFLWTYPVSDLLPSLLQTAPPGHSLIPITLLCSNLYMQSLQGSSTFFIFSLLLLYIIFDVSSMGSCILFYFFVFFSFIFTCFAFQKCFSFIFHYIPCYHSIPSGFIYALLIFSPLLWYP